MHSQPGKNSNEKNGEAKDTLNRNDKIASKREDDCLELSSFLEKNIERNINLTNISFLKLYFYLSQFLG